MTEDTREFWSQRWQGQQTGFHEAKPNELLVQHIDALEKLGEKLRILVPLAGKAEDMRYLASRGHEVVGVEFVKRAVDDFFAETTPEASKLGRFDALSANGITMLCEDFFQMTPDEIGRFDAIYDRAAIVAVEPATREKYVATCRALLKPDAPILLVSLAYDQSKTHGPPWSVDRAAVESLYGSAKLLSTHPVAVPPGRLTAAGVESIEETAYLIEFPLASARG
jgi:thiopurine S-methyltransferase